MLFVKKYKGVIRIFWAIMSFLIIVSMVLLYTPLFTGQSESVIQPEITNDDLSETAVGASSTQTLEESPSEL